MSERNVAGTKNVREIKMKENLMEVDRELDESNAGLVKFNLKLAMRLATYHRDIMTIGLVMTACGTGILGYFGGGRVMPIKDITTVARQLVVLAIVLGCL